MYINYIIISVFSFTSGWAWWMSVAYFSPSHFAIPGTWASMAFLGNPMKEVSVLLGLLNHDSVVCMYMCVCVCACAKVHINKTVSC